MTKIVEVRAAFASIPEVTMTQHVSLEKLLEGDHAILEGDWKPMTTEVYFSKALNAVCVGDLLEDGFRTIFVPPDMHGDIRQVCGWERELLDNPAVAPIYADWCDDHGWLSRAAELRKMAGIAAD